MGKIAHLLAALLLTVSVPADASKQFEDITAAAELSFDHQTTETVLSLLGLIDADPNEHDDVDRMGHRAEIGSGWFSGGVAVGDYDADGRPDIFAAGGDNGVSRLFRNDGDGTFTDKASIAGVAVSGERLTGAMFIDYDGDGDLDLFTGGILGTKPRLFRNNGENGGGEVTFTDVFDTLFPTYDVELTPNVWGGSMGDIDIDGDLDFVFTHSMSPWGPEAIINPGDSTQHLWRNDRLAGGDMVFTDVSVSSGISALYEEPAPQNPNEEHRDQTFSVNFADVNEDGYPDLLFANDRGQSRVLINDREGRFKDITDYSQLLSPGGQFTVDAMGAAVGDFDNDGHFDWFVSQIRRQDDGNRLFKGRGDGTFIDLVSETEPFPAIGMESGHWGWGACFADLNNDLNLDIFHVNGYYHTGNLFSPDGSYENTPAVAFISDGDGTFTERGDEIGLADVGEGRGVSCFDFDRDGDIDIAISNHRGPFKLYENTLKSEPGSGPGFVTVTVSGWGPNTFGVGTIIVLRSSNPGDTGPAQLMRQIAVDNNFVSSNLLEAHFGIGDWQGPFELEVTWPDQQATVHSDVTRNSFVNLTQPPFDKIFSSRFE